MKKLITSLFLMGMLAVSGASYAEEGNKKMGNNVVQTAGHQQLGDFAPKLTYRQVLNIGMVQPQILGSVI